MTFNKEEILSTIDCEVRINFQKLIQSTISILQKIVEENGDVPTRKVLKIMPYSIGYTETMDEKPELYSLIARKIWDLQESKQCSEVFYKNELLGSQGINSFLIISSFVADYLDDIDPKSISFNQRLFDSLFEKYKSLLLSFTCEVLYICPLLGFESEVDSLKLDERLIIRKITADELNEIWNLVSFSDRGFDFKDKLAKVKYVIENRIVQTKKTSDKAGLDSITIVIFALRLLKNGNFWANNQLHKTLLPWKIRMAGISGNSYYLNSPSTKYGYFLGKADEDNLKNCYILSKRLQNLRSKKEYKYLFRAIEWFDRYQNESNIEHRFIFLMLLMEALCSEAAETQNKLSNRISLIIGKEDDERISIINKFKDIYGGPRKIVHGHDVVIMEEDVLLAEDYSRRLLQKFILISLNGYNRDKALKLVDNALVSQGRREELFKALDFEETVNKLNVQIEKSETVLNFLNDELYEIKADLDRFTVYNTNKGFIYKLILINDLESAFSGDSWDKTEEFYTAYFGYLMLLKESSDIVKSIIQKVIHKIKTEKEAFEWKRDYLKRISGGSSHNVADAGGPGYELNNFLQRDLAKNVPQINDDQYLIFDVSSAWDLKITLEDLKRSERSIEYIVQEIHDLVAGEELISKLRKSRVENLKLISSLIKYFDNV